MHINLPSDVKKILNILNHAGYEAFAVGGCVRDSVLGILPYDWDITTSADPYAVKKLFLHTVDTGLKHGTVTVLMNHVGYEVTTYRIDGEYKDARHPEKVIFTKNLEEDLKRRDFTINAMAYNDTLGLIDLFGGEKDLKEGIIKCVGDPEKRFTEDALRILRAFRFAARFGFKIDLGTLEAAYKIAGNIKKVSIERIREELNKILMSDNPDMLIKAYETGVTGNFIWEFDNLSHKDAVCSMIKNAGNGYLIKYPESAQKNILILKWAVLTAYCICAGDAENVAENGAGNGTGNGTSKNCRLKKSIPKNCNSDGDADKLNTFLNRFKFDNYSKHCIKTLSEYVFCDMTDFNAADMRILMSKTGKDLCPMLFELKRVTGTEKYNETISGTVNMQNDTNSANDKNTQNDTNAQNGTNLRDDTNLNEYEKLTRLYDEIIKNNDCTSVSELCITGRDLIGAGIPAGPMVGEILKKLLDEVMKDPSLNQKAELLKRAKRF